MLCVEPLGWTEHHCSLILAVLPLDILYYLIYLSDLISFRQQSKLKKMNLNMSIILSIMQVDLCTKYSILRVLLSVPFAYLQYLSIISCQETKHNFSGIPVSRDYCNECLHMFAPFTIQSISFY